MRSIKERKEGLEAQSKALLIKETWNKIPSPIKPLIYNLLQEIEGLSSDYEIFISQLINENTKLKRNNEFVNKELTDYRKFYFDIMENAIESTDIQTVKKLLKHSYKLDKDIDSISPLENGESRSKSFSDTLNRAHEATEKNGNIKLTKKR